MNTKNVIHPSQLMQLSIAAAAPYAQQVVSDYAIDSVVGNHWSSMSDNDKLIELIKQEIRRRAFASGFSFDESELIGIHDSGKDFVFLRSRIVHEAIIDARGLPTGKTFKTNKVLFYCTLTESQEKYYTVNGMKVNFVSLDDRLLFVVENGVACGLDGSVITLPQGDA